MTLTKRQRTNDEALWEEKTGLSGGCRLWRPAWAAHGSRLSVVAAGTALPSLPSPVFACGWQGGLKRHLGDKFPSCPRTHPSSPIPYCIFTRPTKYKV